jgi:hypothetical protein
MRTTIRLMTAGLVAALLSACAGQFQYHDEATLDPPSDKDSAPAVQPR